MCLLYPHFYLCCGVLFSSLGSSNLYLHLSPRCHHDKTADQNKGKSDKCSSHLVNGVLKSIVRVQGSGHDAKEDQIHHLIGCAVSKIQKERTHQLSTSNTHPVQIWVRLETKTSQGKYIAISSEVNFLNITEK